MWMIGSHVFMGSGVMEGLETKSYGSKSFVMFSMDNRGEQNRGDMREPSPVLSSLVLLVQA